MGKDQELLEAARSGNITLVEKILHQKSKRSGPLASLRRGVGPNIQDASGYTPLHHAALNGHKDIVKILLCNAASANVVDNKGSSPLHLASWTGNLDIVKLLLSHGPSIAVVNLMTKNNETALHCASQYGHTNIVCLLLQYSCNPVVRNIRQETALDLAAQYGRLETVDLLVGTHHELIQPYNGTSDLIFPHTPLHLASRNGHKAVVDVLLAGGMDVNVRTSAGTALHEAALCGKTEVVKTLIDHGIDLNIRDAQNNTVLDILKQFPCHVVHDIYSIISKYKDIRKGDYGDDVYSTISVSSLASPYDRFSSGSIVSVSPAHANPYNKRLIGNCSISMASDMLYSHFVSYGNPPGISKSYVDSSYISDDTSCSRSREFDTLSMCSTASSSCSRDRRSPNFGGHIQLPSPSSFSNKISPIPPKKPPRRILSASPTYGTHSPSDYDSSFDYTFSKCGIIAESFQSHEVQGCNGGGGKHRDGSFLRRGKSAENYADAKFRHSVTIETSDMKPSVLIRGKSEDSQLCDDKVQPIAITSMYGNIPYRTTNPRRKLRRQSDRNASDYDTSAILSRGDLPFRKMESCSSNSPITIERVLTPGAERKAFKVKSSGNREGANCPLSPTNYNQPPTPDHPPPSAVLAEERIYDRIRPLSQEYSYLKRKSRDIETETEEELLLLVFPSIDMDTASTGNSMDDKITSAPCIDEFVGDIPFAGLFKGSVTPEMNGSGYKCKAERPHSLQQLQSNICKEDVPNGSGNGTTYRSSGSDKMLSPTKANEKLASAAFTEKSMSVLSPFDEEEELAKITEIMASFGNGSEPAHESTFVNEFENEFKARFGLSGKNTEVALSSHATLGEWLDKIGYSEYEKSFVNFGYDRLDFINGVLNDCDLKEMGVMKEEDRNKILKESVRLTNRVGEFWSGETWKTSNNSGDLVKNWLASMELSLYLDTFRKNMYTDLDKIRRLWEVELTAVLEISKPGHRRRILASANVVKTIRTQGATFHHPDTNRDDGSISSNLDHLNADLNLLKTNIRQLENDIRGNSGKKEYVRPSHRKSRPAPPPPVVNKEKPPLPNFMIRSPSELLTGLPLISTTQWKHQPNALVTGTANYVASYLGSTVVKELHGTVSTKKSIQKLKKSTSVVDCRITPEIVLSISYKGVKFLNVSDKSPICEHEIRNIHCACQDAEDLTHFAYITKDRESNVHYCHVFCVQTMDQATEIILTLGEAFEVAYQMVLKETKADHSASQARSHSSGEKSEDKQASHSRSQSISASDSSYRDFLHKQQQQQQQLQQQQHHAVPTRPRFHSVGEVKISTNGNFLSLSSPSRNSAGSRESSQI